LGPIADGGLLVPVEAGGADALLVGAVRAALKVPAAVGLVRGEVLVSLL